MGLGKMLQAITLSTYLHEEGFLVNESNEPCQKGVLLQH